MTLKERIKDLANTKGISQFPTLIRIKKGNEKVKFENQKMCLCQNCGNSWEIK